MSVDGGKPRRQRRPYEPPLTPESPWPTPTPGVPILRRREEDRTLKQILGKLEDIERRLDKIEKRLSGRGA